MIVTGLEKISADRFKVFLDGEFAFVLYKGELYDYKITEGQSFSDSAYQEIVEKLLPRRAKLRAMNLLKGKRYTEKQLIDKLKEGHYSDSVIMQAIDYLKSYHYLDDFQFAVDYITYHESTKSCRKMEMELKKKGIPDSVCKQAMFHWQSLGGEQDEMQMIKEILQKKNYSSDCDEKEKRRIYAFLLRKGFSIDHVNRALSLEEI